MKKYIFTESQIKKIIDTQINEQNSMCGEGLLKNAIIDDEKPNIREKIKTGKFKVIEIKGDVKLNGKKYDMSSVQKGIIITPNTTISICSGSSMIMSGMGLPECGVFQKNNGIRFVPQVA
jgi:hypothetical protein